MIYGMMKWKRMKNVKMTKDGLALTNDGLALTNDGLALTNDGLALFLTYKLI